jgi:UDP-hydrolysing UDP-N-acetyl-D-glucosamine 2-epimerase
MKPLRVLIVTGTRAEYGLLEPLMARLRRDRAFRPAFLVTGAHLDRRQGLTVREIEADGHPIAARVPLRQRGDGAEGVAGAMAEGVRGFSRAYARLKPDLIVVLGDRFEILAAAAAALPHRIPVAHLHGGESSEGVWDESIRHAVTKLAHLHFPSHAEYARRLRLMGEDPRRIFVVGATAEDRVRSLPRMGRGELSRSLQLALGRPLIAATYHPATLSADRGLAECRAMLAALDKARGTVVLTAPNSDAGGGAVRRELEAFVRRHPVTAKLFDSLGQKRYYSLLACADAMIGNSSSGLLEAPYFALPVVNLGRRQQGRRRGPNVIDVPRATADAAARALRRALSPAFRRGLRSRIASGSPSARIVSALKKLEWDDALLIKRFHEIR